MTGQCLRRFTLANKLQAWLTVAQRQADALTPSLLARAFRGWLAPQTRTTIQRLFYSRTSG